MYHPRLPLGFILLWAANIAVLLVISFATGLHQKLMRLQMQNLVALYTGIAAVLAALEQALWEKLRGE